VQNVLRAKISHAVNEKFSAISGCLRETILDSRLEKSTEVRIALSAYAVTYFITELRLKPERRGLDSQ
jgi:hypothetical protein